MIKRIVNGQEVIIADSYDSLDSKQDKLTGRPDEIVSFDENGNAIAKYMNMSQLLYSFSIDDSESNPASKISYTGPNAGYTPAHTNLTTGKFDYGDWADAWFIKGIKPCLLNFDGTVAYELDPNDYTKKVDGTAADIANVDNGGNVMVGIPTVWIKIETSGTRHKILVASEQLDSDFKAWAHTDENGIVKPYVYLPAYNGYTDANSKQRSLSGVIPTRLTTASDEMTRCRANNPSGVSGWDLENIAQRMLINILLMLIGRSTDTQTTFGSGNVYGYYNKATGSDDYGVLPTGTMNDKGLFYGVSANNLGVKVFGIENWWGNIWRRTAGYVNASGTQKVKLTKSTSDGSTATDYNTDGTGYVSLPISPITASGDYILSMYAVSNNSLGLYPQSVPATQSTGYCDGLWTNNAQNNFAFFGGSSAYSVQCGAFACILFYAASNSFWDSGGAPSFL